MLNNDLLCRFAVYPKFLKESVFDDEQLLNFRSVDKRKKIYVLSVVSEYLCRDEKRIHEFGEKTANVQNNRNPSSNIAELPRVMRSYYLGYYQLRYKDVINISMQYYRIGVKYCPQDDCDTHFHIEMHQSLSHDGATRRQKQHDRIYAVNEMAKHLEGPRKPDVSKESYRIELMKILPEKHFST